MASKKKNLSDVEIETKTDFKKYKIGIVVSEWNFEITNSLFKGCKDTLLKHGVKQKNIIVKHVPGSFELPLGASYLLSMLSVDAVICLGCVIQGETRHFDFICNAVSQGIMNLNLQYSKPVIFGVLTTNNYEQAADRSGGKHGNKGDEAAYTVLKMIGLNKEIIDNSIPF